MRTSLKLLIYTTIIFMIFLILFFIFINRKYYKPINLECIVEQQDKLKDFLKADYVSVQAFKYNDHLLIPSIQIYNSDARSLNFKKLPIDRFKPLENYKKIYDGLYDEGNILLELLKENCDLSKYQYIRIEYRKQNNEGKLNYLIDCTYRI